MATDWRDPEYELSGSEEHALLDSALEALSWSEHAWCVPSDPSPITQTVLCHAHATDCEHLMLDAKGFDLPEFLDGIEYLEWEEHSRAQLREDLQGFIDGSIADLTASDLSLEQVAHDFVLTRNGHGTGFWDRGLGAVGLRLTDAAKAYGSANAALIAAWKDDDGEIHARAVIE